MFKGLSQGWPGWNGIPPYIRGPEERARDFELVNQGYLGYMNLGYSAREVDLFVWLETLRDKQCEDRACELGVPRPGKEPKGGCAVKIHIPEMLQLLGTGACAYQRARSNSAAARRSRRRTARAADRRTDAGGAFPPPSRPYRHGSGQSPPAPPRPQGHQAGQHPGKRRDRRGAAHRVRHRISPIARATGEPPEALSGTLAYMAPEQTGRMNRSVDSRSDLYALGVTFYQMLTGALPFTAADPMEWVHSHLAKQPAPADRVKQVPSAVSAIIIKLLAKTAEDRYQIAAGLESDLLSCPERGKLQPPVVGRTHQEDPLLMQHRLR